MTYYLARAVPEIPVTSTQTATEARSDHSQMHTNSRTQFEAINTTKSQKEFYKETVKFQLYNKKLCINSNAAAAVLTRPAPSA